MERIIWYKLHMFETMIYWCEIGIVLLIAEYNSVVAKHFGLNQ